MKAETIAGSGQGIVSIVMALVGALFIFGVLTNRNVPLVSSSRGALVALVVLGFIMCSVGGLSNKVGKAGFFWLSPFVILGILLGLSAAYVTFAGLTGRSLPFVTGEHGAFILLSGIIVAKWLLSRFHTLQLG
jgi:hypothetical protein